MDNSSSVTEFIEEMKNWDSAMTKTDIAKIVGLNRMSLRNYEQGRMPKHIDNYFKLCYLMLRSSGLQKFIKFMEGE